MADHLSGSIADGMSAPVQLSEPEQSTQDATSQQSHQFGQAHPSHPHSHSQQPLDQHAQFSPRNPTQGLQSFASPSPVPQASAQQPDYQPSDLDKAPQHENHDTDAPHDLATTQPEAPQDVGQVTDQVPSEPLRLESEDGEGEEDVGPEGPPVKRQRLEEELGQDHSLDDDPVLALANANNGAGAADSYHTE